MRRGTALLVVATSFALGACSEPISSTSTAKPSVVRTVTPSAVATTLPAQARLALDPAQLADNLVADERALRDPASTEAVLVDAARRQQVAYRTLARNPEWEAIARPRIPAPLLGIYDYNIDARHQLNGLLGGQSNDTLPAWRVDAPAPADELLGYYREAESATGVGWNYLAAINQIETTFGRVVGLSSAGAHGPMQFMPSTFAAYGGNGDIFSPHDSIIAAGRYLAANGFSQDPDHALFRYNNSDLYVRAVKDYAAVLASDPSAFAGYYRWDVYYRTTAGDVLLPIGYIETSPIPVADYLAAHPQ
jgi:soluble lytic murein transglycosylase-like protein